MLGVGRFGPCGRDDPGGDGGGPRRDAPDAVDDREREAWVVLNEVEQVGPVTFARLIEVFGTARRVLATASAPGGPARLVDAVADPDGGSPLLPSTARAIADAAADPDATLAPVRRAGVDVLVLADAAYPRRLRLVQLPPPVLYVRGSISALEPARAVAIVGTRRPTEIGRGTASRIGEALAALGVTIVSGLALGIDAAAHGASVAQGSPTVAVIGGGHERLYPSAHRALVRRIVDGGGAVISEFAPETTPSRGTFPRRNRIISGLADATVVVEAGARSGALTTAAWALEQGRGLFLVPGRLDDPAVAGSLAFLREAGPDARIVAGIPELLEDLAILGALPTRVAAAGGHPSFQARPLLPAAVLAMLPPVERALARQVIAGLTSVDELVAATGLGGATVLSALTALELRGLVLETFGRYRPTGGLAGSGTHTVLPPAVARALAARTRRKGEAA